MAQTLVLPLCDPALHHLMTVLSSCVASLLEQRWEEGGQSQGKEVRYGKWHRSSTLLISSYCCRMTGQESPAVWGMVSGRCVKKDVKSELMSWLWEAVMAPGEGVESARLALSCLFWPRFLLQTRSL